MRDSCATWLAQGLYLHGGVAALAAPRLDLLVTDVTMPGMHGPALAARVREQRPGLPVVFVSGLADRKLPTVSSTKSLTGHSQGATGAHEAIYSLLMLKEDFVAASANIENIDPGVGDYPIARQRIDKAGLQTVMSNSFGFGGTNACLVFSRYGS